jgi:regulatory subunit for Cdc7p protein kinase
MVEKDNSSAQLATPRRKIPPSTVEGRVFERGSVNGQPTAFQRKLEAPIPQNIETIRQWQKHYRKLFPDYTFYFESIPEDLKARFSRQITSLGAVRLSLAQLSFYLSSHTYLLS